MSNHTHSRVLIGLISAVLLTAPFLTAAQSLGDLDLGGLLKDISAISEQSVKQTISGRIIGGGDTTPKGFYDAPRKFVYQVKQDNGAVVHVTYTAYPPSPVGDRERKKIRLSFYSGSIKTGDYLKAYGGFDNNTQTLTVADEGDYIETSKITGQLPQEEVNGSKKPEKPKPLCRKLTKKELAKLKKAGKKAKRDLSCPIGSVKAPQGAGARGAAASGLSGGLLESLLSETPSEKEKAPPPTGTCRAVSEKKLEALLPKAPTGWRPRPVSSNTIKTFITLAGYGGKASSVQHDYEGPKAGPGLGRALAIVNFLDTCDRYSEYWAHQQSPEEKSGTYIGYPAKTTWRPAKDSYDYVIQIGIGNRFVVTVMGGNSGVRAEAPSKAIAEQFAHLVNYKAIGALGN
jgi:hypothetical protein